MIKVLDVNNFKCFRKGVPFNFTFLNLLTGINGRGKSSLLQSMLLISQSVSKFSKIQKVLLNGKHIALGNFDDIKNSETPREEPILIHIEISDIVTAEFKLVENENDLMTAKVKDLVVTIKDEDELAHIGEKLNKLRNDLIDELDAKQETTDAPFDINQAIFSEFISYIHYISADRLGPVKYVDKVSFADFISVGPRGEFTINVLANDNLPLVSDNLYLGNDSKSLIQQTQEWLSYILDGAKLVVKGKEKESSVLYMLLNNRNTTNDYKPSNVGFGYSYILPLIVTGLIAKPGEIIIVENPEAHLHPKAQSKISEFFTRVAAGGVQVFIESHSEHILNGLRVSTLNPEIAIKHDDLTIHYFDEAFEAVKLTMDEKGKIHNWPKGFFDQQEIDIAEIFKYARKL